MKHNTLEIDHDNLYFGVGDRPSYHQCTMSDIQPLPYGWQGVNWVRCGAAAMYLVSFFNKSANRVITHHVCDKHLTTMIESAIKSNCAINDLR